jgi:ribulose kinase
MIAVTIIYDIGKTNKKMAVLDHQLNILYQQQITIDEIYDEDNFPSENLAALTDWMFQSLKAIIESREFIVEKINFSAYGATMVHLDNNGKVLTPVYNYLKNIPENIVVEFLAKYSSQLAIDTASPVLGMLNAGMQLYWLKYTKPEIYGTIKYALHLPQYLSYLFTGKFYSDITSIGCHTLLWHFERNDYHDWVYQEGIHEKLAPIQEIDHMELVNIFDQKIRVGLVGIEGQPAGDAECAQRVAHKMDELQVGVGADRVHADQFLGESECLRGDHSRIFREIPVTRRRHAQGPQSG